MTEQERAPCDLCRLKHRWSYGSPDFQDHDNGTAECIAALVAEVERLNSELVEACSVDIHLTIRDKQRLEKENRRLRKALEAAKITRFPEEKGAELLLSPGAWDLHNARIDAAMRGGA